MKTINGLVLFIFILLGTVALSCQDELGDETRVSTTGEVTTNSMTSKGKSSRTGDSDLKLVGDPISLATAKAWTANYRSKNPDQVKAHFFGFEIIDKILMQNGCVGIRMYYAIDDNGGKQIVLVGVDSKGNDMTPSTLELNLEDPNTIADISFPCPSFCPPEEF